MKARAGQSIKHEFLVHILSGTWQKVADRWIGKLGWLGGNYFQELHAARRCPIKLVNFTTDRLRRLTFTHFYIFIDTRKEILCQNVKKTVILQTQLMEYYTVLFLFIFSHLIQNYFLGCFKCQELLSGILNEDLCFNVQSDI